MNYQVEVQEWRVRGWEEKTEEDGMLVEVQSVVVPRRDNCTYIWVRKVERKGEILELRKSKIN